MVGIDSFIPVLWIRCFLIMWHILFLVEADKRTIQMKIFFLPILSLIILLTSCYSMKSSSGGGQDVNFSGVRIPDPDDVALPEGFMIEVVASGLTFPTGITFDETGKACITESGYSYGEVFKEPKLIRINQDGTKETILTGTQNGPWNGVWFSNGYFYIAEGGQLEGGKILKADMQGNINVLVDNLPSLGDHHTNGPVVHQGYVWFGQGTATNSSVVGIDNYQFGWLKRYSDFHDIPCMDIKLAGVNFTTENALEEGSSQELQTGAYLPYGVASEPGQRDFRCCPLFRSHYACSPTGW